MNWRFFPGLAFLALLGAKMVWPALLAQRVVAQVPVTWFVLAFFVLGYVAAWCITKPTISLLNKVGRKAFLPLAFFLVVLLGIVALSDLAWNELVASWCTTCGHADLIHKILAAISGGA